MPLYQTYPTIIEAVEWTGDNLQEILALTNHTWIDYDDINGLIVITESGRVSVNIGDFISMPPKSQREPDTRPRPKVLDPAFMRRNYQPRPTV